jgi:hypothetical protein
MELLKAVADKTLASNRLSCQFMKSKVVERKCVFQTD